MALYRLIAKRESETPVSVARIEFSQLDDRVRFLPGHPRKGAVYASNPRRDLSYIPIADFHRVVLREKSGELLRLLTSLGASRAQLVVRRGTGRELGAGFGLAVPGEVPVKAAAKGSSKRRSTSENVYVFQLQPRGGIQVPDDLIWLEHEPDWQALVNARLNGSASELRMMFRYADDFGINASLGLGLLEMGLGVEAVGSVAEFHEEEWEVTVEFAATSIESKGHPSAAARLAKCRQCGKRVEKRVTYVGATGAVCERCWEKSTR